MTPNSESEPVSSSSSSGDSVTSKPFVQKAIGIIIILAIIGVVGYLLYKGGALQKVPFLKNFLPKG